MLPCMALSLLSMALIMRTDWFSALAGKKMLVHAVYTTTPMKV